MKASFGWTTGNLDDRRRRTEDRSALGGDHDRERLVGPVDRDFLRNVVERRPRKAGGTDQNQRLTRQVDVLLVLGRVAGDRLVAQLGELDADLLGGGQIRPVADHRPGPPTGRASAGDLGDLPSTLEDRVEGRGNLAQAAKEVLLRLAEWGLVDDLTQAEGEQMTGRDLGIERLRRRHAHFDVAAVGGVENAIRLVGEVAAASVDDRHDRRAPRTHQVDRPVGVGRRARLADGAHQRVAHVVAHPETGEFRGGQRLDRQGGGKNRPHGLGDSPPGDRRRPLADQQHSSDLRRQAFPDRRRQGRIAEQDLDRAVLLDDLPSQGLAERVRSLTHLLEEEVRIVAAVDVSRRDRGLMDLRLFDRQGGAVVGEPFDAFEGAGGVGVEHDHLAAAGARILRIAGGLPVETDVATRLFDQAVGFAGDEEGAFEQTDVQRLAAAVLRQQQFARLDRALRRDRDRARERRDGGPEGLGQ